MEWKEWVERAFAKQWANCHPGMSPEEMNRALSRIPFSRKALAACGIASIAAVTAGCSDEPVYTAYEECLWEEQQLGVDYECEDDDDWFYKSRKYLGKSHVLNSSSKYYQYKMSAAGGKGGIGSGSAGSFGG